MTSDNPIKEIVLMEFYSHEVKKKYVPAFLSGILRGMGELQFSKNGFKVKFESSSYDLIYHIYKTLTELYGEKFYIETKEFKKGESIIEKYVIPIDTDISNDLLDRCGLVKNKFEIIDIIPKSVIDSHQSKREFLKGLFLSCGNLVVPSTSMDEKSNGYKLSYSLNSDIVKDEIIDIISQEAQIDRESILKNKKTNEIFIRAAEKIAMTLTCMGSVSGVLQFYDVIATRKMHNDLNRTNNIVVGNIGKTVVANQNQINAIKKLKKYGGYKKLSPELKELCDMREKYPDLDLVKLGKMFSPELSKSCVNHRLRRIIELSKEE